MINILVVDDNKDRLKTITANIKSKTKVGDPKIFTAECTNDAMLLLSKYQFDILILDVVLPKKRFNDPPSSNQGLQLLDEITDPDSRLYKPGRIIGITSVSSSYEDFQIKFMERCFALIDVHFDNNKWINNLLEQVNYTISSLIHKPNTSISSYLISVHGIRTYGQWQENLRNLISHHSNSVKVYEYKYGYFPILSFLLPPLRHKEIRNFLHSFESLTPNLENKRLIFVAHSFGTYIVIKALRIILEKQHSLNVLVILAGSVLNPKKDIDFIYDKNVHIINDCSPYDLTLIASHLFVFGCSMAGRVGFHSISNRVVNRFFKGGHSLYFKQTDDNQHMAKYWLPYILSDLHPEPINRNDTSAVEGFLEALIAYGGKIKAGFWVVLSSFIYYLISYRF